LAKKRGKGIKKLELIMERLANGAVLEKKHWDHDLIGNFANRRECHIEPDWLLIYKIDGTRIIFERTGTHSDLFK
jgi:mRNA interferase YafQ